MENGRFCTMAVTGERTASVSSCLDFRRGRDFLGPLSACEEEAWEFCPLVESPSGVGALSSLLSRCLVSSSPLFGSYDVWSVRRNHAETYTASTHFLSTFILILIIGPRHATDVNPHITVVDFGVFNVDGNLSTLNGGYVDKYVTVFAGSPFRDIDVFTDEMSSQ